MRLEKLRLHGRKESENNGMQMRGCSEAARVHKPEEWISIYQEMIRHVKSSMCCVWRC